MNKLEYNEIGQLKAKKLHSTNGTDYIQKIDYAYNERGWLTKINDPDALSNEKVFGMTLNYGNRPGAYNGNIGSVSWQTKVPAGLNLMQTLQSYNYDYDKLNRLTKADYTTPGSTCKFNEELDYDVMGNITNLKRTNAMSGYLNNLSYNYLQGGNPGNKLYGVTDLGTAGQSSTYTYDDNGNQKTNTRIGITDIEYNYLNLPQAISKSSTGEVLSYADDATGNKLKKQLGTQVTSYAGGIQYSGSAIDFIMTEEGRAVPGSSYTYEYFLKDHLGNTRATVKQNGDVVQVQDYYAFGLEMNPGNGLSPSPQNNYKYNGKEKQTELGLDQLDYGARFYDPVIGRWNTVDPHTESYESITPYSYAFNNPVRFIDLKGKDPGDVIVFFAGANLFSDGGLGETPKMVEDLQKRYLQSKGGSAKAFTSDIYKYVPGQSFDGVGGELTEVSLDDATEDAYNYVKATRTKEGDVIIYGYSYGGVLANYLSKRLAKENISTKFLVTIDAAKGPLSDKVDRTIDGNVEDNLNVYQTT